MTHRLRAGPSAAENGHGHSQSDGCRTGLRAPQWQRQRSDFTSGGGGGGSSEVAGVTRQVTCSIDPPSEYQQMAAAPRANVQHFPLRTAVSLPNRNHNLTVTVLTESFVLHPPRLRNRGRITKPPSVCFSVSIYADWNSNVFSRQRKVVADQL